MALVQAVNRRWTARPRSSGRLLMAQWCSWAEVGIVVMAVVVAMVAGTQPHLARLGWKEKEMVRGLTSLRTRRALACRVHPCRSTIPKQWPGLSEGAVGLVCTAAKRLR